MISSQAPPLVPLHLGGIAESRQLHCVFLDLGGICPHASDHRPEVEFDVLHMGDIFCAFLGTKKEENNIGMEEELWPRQKASL